MTFLSPLSGNLPSVHSEDSREVVPVPAPSWFRPPLGTITRAHIEVNQSYVRGKGNTAARLAGLRYEGKVQEALMEMLPTYQAGPTLAFRDDSGPRIAIPDGLYFTERGKIGTIFEIKISHMPDAWWQLERKYRPILQVALPNWRLQCLEIVRTFDSSVPFPCKFDFLTGLDQMLPFLEGRGREPFGVFQWRP